MSAPSEAVSTKPDEDPDGDGLTNQEEAEIGTNPMKWDTDNDGVGDGEDGWPFDPDLNPSRRPLPHYAIIAIQGENLIPVAINEKGAVLLQTGVGAPYYLYENNVISQMPMPESFTVPGYQFDTDSHPVWDMAAVDLSDNGTVVGWLQTDGSWISQVAFSWRKNDTTVSVLRDSLVESRTEPVDFSYSYTPEAINQADEIVGSNNYMEAIYWSATNAFPNLFGGLLTDSSMPRLLPKKINSLGVIAAEYCQFNAQNTAIIERGVGIWNGAFNRIAIEDSNHQRDVLSLTDEMHLLIGVRSAALQPPELWAHKDGEWIRKVLPISVQWLGSEMNNNLEVAFGDTLWHNSRPFELRKLNDSSHWEGLVAHKINDSEVLAGTAKRIENNYEQAVLLVPVDIAVDANRDGTIRFAGNFQSTQGKPTDTTTEAKPFRFWINDDDDKGAQGTEQVPVANPDNNDDHIGSVRDLEDFTRLQLYFGGLQAGIADGTFKIGLKWKDANGTNPSIKVYKSADPNGSDDYVKDEQAGADQFAAEYRAAIATVTGATAAMLPQSLFANYSEQNPVAHLLFEGVSEGKGQLCVTIHKSDGTEIGEGPGVWLDLKGIKKMYQSSEGDMFAGAPPDEAKQTVVSVHGWNMSPEGSRNYAETMFKRLWHRGFKGRFAYFRWNTYWVTATDVIGTLTTQYFANYNNSEYNAWTQGAPALKSFVESLPYQSKNIAAHSMGNIVVGEAMRLGMQVNNYALMQPAVPAACYDEREVLKQTGTYQHSFLGVDVTMWDEASPDDDPDETTRNMAYRGMLKDIGQNGNLILFYLPNDAATSNAWELNNDLTKPSGTLSGQFRYDRNAPTGQKLYRDFGGGLHEYSWTSRRESATFACRTWGKAAGADGRTQGAISEAGRVDLSGPAFALPGETEPGFGDEHSGQFTARIQFLKPFYDELMRRLDIGDPNP